MELLLVIDMQRFFFQHGDYTSVIENCQKEIKSAIKNQLNIIYLRFADAGKIISSLYNLTINYPKTSCLTKNIEDGSSWVEESLNIKNITPKVINVTGVQTDMCVFNTVEGLSFLYPNTKIRIIEKSCGAIYTHSHNKAIQLMGKFPNVTII